MYLPIFNVPSPTRFSIRHIPHHVSVFAGRLWRTTRLDSTRPDSGRGETWSTSRKVAPNGYTESPTDTLSSSTTHNSKRDPRIHGDTHILPALRHGHEKTLRLQSQPNIKIHSLRTAVCTSQSRFPVTKNSEHGLLQTCTRYPPLPLSLIHI